MRSPSVWPSAMMARVMAMSAGLASMSRTKRFVHLEAVDVKALEVGQAGISGAKVIDGQLHAQRL